MADKKISELTSIVGADTAADDFFVVVDTSGSVTKKISRAELNNAIEQDVLAQVDITSANIDGGTIDNTPIGSTTASTGNFTTVDTTGNVTVGGNLTVNGTTTTVNSTTLDVDDINITVASGAASAAAADGAGLTVDGASATFNYASTGDKWTMNKPLDVSGTVTMTGATTTGDINFGDNDKAVFGAGGDFEIVHTGTNTNLRENGTGNLNVWGDDIYFYNSAGTETKASYLSNGAVTLYYDNAAKLATSATGAVITGTLTADDLTLEGSSAGGFVENTLIADYHTGQAQNNSEIQFTTGTYQNTGEIKIRTAFGATMKDRIRVGQLGDISFYADDGTTQGFFWDASTQRLGLGTTSPAYALDVKASGSFNSAKFTGQGASISTYIYSDSVYWAFGDAPSYGGNLWGGHATNNELYAYTNGSERMRIDSSGSLMAGKTATNIANDGFEAHANNYVGITRNASIPLFLNRRTDDGGLIQFRKDNSEVGSVGTVAGDLYIANAVDVGLYLESSVTDHIAPCNISGAKRDAAIDLGSSSARFRHLHLSGGIYLGGSGAANYLNDYEEGTWTPSADSGLSGASGASGKYTKVGRAVYCEGGINVTGITGDIIIGGLPFTNSSRTSTVTALLAGGVTATQNSFVDSSATTFNIQRTGTYSGSAISIYFACWYFI